MLFTLLGICMAGPPPAPTVAAASGDSGDFDAMALRRSMGMDYGVRQVGDLVTVTVLESNTSTMDATTATNRQSSANGRVGGFFGLVSQVLSANPTMNLFGEDVIGLEASSGNDFAGTGTTDRGASMSSVVTCEVLEVSPQGNLHLWGYKAIAVNNETQYIVVEGWARPRDISMQNVVAHERLAEAQISTYGDGVIDDKQRVGLGTRLMDRIWPF
jgi:flagellar L-ring protein precursor FlgH